MDKSPDAFRTISEAAEELDLPQHVLRFWETRFTTIKPMKRGGGRRYYRPEDVLLLKGIRHLLYDQGFTIKGVQRILKEQGARHVVALGQGVPADQLPEFSVSSDDSDDEGNVEVDVGDAAAVSGPSSAPVPSVPERQPLVLAETDRERLTAVLRDLLECKRILERAREG